MLVYGSCMKLTALELSFTPPSAAASGCSWTCGGGMQGNVVLTDASYKVLAAQRTYKDDTRGWAVSPGLLYPVSMIRLYENLDAPALEAALAAAEPKFTLKSARFTPRLLLRRQRATCPCGCSALYTLRVKRVAA